MDYPSNCNLVTPTPQNPMPHLSIVFSGKLKFQNKRETKNLSNNLAVALCGGRAGGTDPPKTRIGGENKLSNDLLPPNGEPKEKLCVVILDFDVGPFTILSWYFLPYHVPHSILNVHHSYCNVDPSTCEKKFPSLFDEGSKIR